MEKYRALFVSESEAHLEALGQGIVALETDPAHLNEVFRHLHSLKGMSATMSYDTFAEVCHLLEDMLGGVRDNHRAIDRDLVETLLFANDQLALFVAAIRDHANPPSLDGVRRKLSGPKREAQSAAPAVATDKFALRVFFDEASSTPALRAFLAAKRLAQVLGAPLSQSPPMESLKANELPGYLLTMVYEATIDDAKVKETIASLSDIVRYEIQGSVRAAPRSDVRAVRVRTAVLDDLLDATGELLIAESRIEEVLGAKTVDGPVARAFELLHQTIRNVHGRVMALRMVPFSSVAERYPRIVRDAASASGKLVELRVLGHELELDRAVLEAVDSSIMHLLRNAVDHGIEAPERRQSKSRTGLIELRAERDRDAIAITVQDDGGGIDEQALRHAAAGRGTIMPSGALSAAQMLRVMTSPGFSTKSAVSALSGRGVGLDVVQEAVDSLGGTLELVTQPGQGTRFVLRLPPSVAVLPVVRIGQWNQTFGVALRRVLATEEVPEALRHAAVGSMRFRGEDIVVHSMGRAFNAQADERMAVVVQTPSGPAALKVERVVDVREVVVKKLGPPLNKLPAFDGATVMSDGRPMMILDVARLIGQYLS